MKINRFIILLGIGVAGCSTKDGDTAYEAAAALTLNSGVQQFSGTYIPLPEKTVAGLFITSIGAAPATAATGFYNLKSTADLNGRLLRENPVQLKEGESYTVYAYAPYQEGIDDPESVPFTYGTDVMGCAVPAEVREVSAEQRTATLQFMHSTAQIRFVTKIIDEASMGGLTATSVLKATGFLPEGRLNITNGILTGSGEPSESTAIKAAAAYDGTTGKYKLESQAVCFFILPNTLQTIQLRVTHNGMTRTGSITQTFYPGESYTYTIYVEQQSELTLQARLTPWINENETINFD